MVWKNAGLERLRARIEAIPGIAEDRLEELVEEAVIEGAHVQGTLIATTGTGWENRSGRVDTGAMLEAVKSSKPKRSGSTVSAEFGWLEDPQDYYVYQEQGFRHYRTGNDVKGMHALLDGFTAAKEVVVRGLARMVK